MKLRHALFALVLVLPGCDAVPSPSGPAAAEQSVRDARRIVALQGGRNFRDLGGYRTTDGQRVRWGLLYRSGSPAHLTRADFATLDRLGIRMVCDLRSTRERQREPNLWAAEGKVPYWSRDYDLDMAGVIGALKDGRPSRDRSRAAMIADYRKMPEVQAPAYAAIFRQLAAGHVPLAFNCSAGKDRTGLGSALILSLLGVPRATILADYALSDKVVDYRAELKKDAATNDSAATLSRLDWAVVQPLMASDPAYLQAAFAAIEERYGSVARYVELRLGVTQPMARAIRRRLLVPA